MVSRETLWEEGEMCRKLCASAIAVLPVVSYPSLASGAGNGPLAIVGQLGGNTLAVDVIDGVAFIGLGPRMLIVDTTDPGHPVELGRTPLLPEVVEDVQVAGDFAYVAAGRAGLLLFSVADTAHPVLLSSYDTSSYAYSLDVDGDTVYVADGWGGLLVFSVANRAAPLLLGSYATPQSARDVRVEGNLAFVPTYGLGMKIISVADKAHPALIGTTGSNYGVGVHVVGNYAYLVSAHDVWGTIPEGLYIYDIAALLHSISTEGYSKVLNPTAVRVQGDTAYVTNSTDGLHVLSVADRDHPTGMYVIRTPGSAQDLDLSGQTAYVADSSGGLRLIALAGGVPVESGSFDLAFSPTRVQVEGDTAYVAAGWDGLLTVSVTQDSMPVGIDSFVSECPARDVRLQNDTVYLVSGGIYDKPCGLHILSAHDGGLLAPIGFFELRDLLPEQHFPQALHVQGDYAYVADGWGGIRIISVANSAHPVQTGFYKAAGMSISDIAVAGDFAYAGASMSGGLRVISVADKAHPAQVGTWGSVSVNMVAAFSNHVMLGVGSGGLRVLSVADPAHPGQVGDYDTPGYPADLAFAGDLAFIADSGADLLVLDVGDPAHLAKLDSLSTPGSPEGVAVARDHVYVADASGGLLVLSHLQQALYLPLIWHEGTVSCACSRKIDRTAASNRSSDLYRDCGSKVK
jgi:hypothetical protein